EYHDRQSRLATRLLALNHTAFVAEPGPTLQFLVGPSVAWHLSERPFLLIVTATSKVCFVFPTFEATRAMEVLADAAVPLPLCARTWDEDGSAYEEVVRILADVGGVIALDPSARSFLRTGLGAMGLKVTPGAAVIEPLRAVKSRAEIAVLRRANELTKAAIAAAARAAEIGWTEDQLQKTVLAALARVGFTETWTLSLFGANAAFPHGTLGGGGRLGDGGGTMVLIDAGGALGIYQSDISRSFWFGEVGGAPQELKDAWETVSKAQLAALNAIAIGVECRAIDAAARNVIATAGFGSGFEHFTHRLGHGIGLEGHEGPYIVGNNPTPLVPGMAFSLEPGIYSKGRFGIRIEDIVAIGEDGRVEVFGALSTNLDDPFHGHSVIL
ncbi:peptidase M24, structural domain-containing protein, partial [Blyttiomyces helicus]